MKFYPLWEPDRRQYSPATLNQISFSENAVKLEKNAQYSI